MLDLVEQHRDRIAALCRQFGASRLELIGSAARGNFDPRKSDLDFLVDFEDPGWRGASKRYFGLLHGLEDVLGRSIDLVERQSVTREFLKVAEQHRETLYGA